MGKAAELNGKAFSLLKKYPHCTDLFRMQGGIEGLVKTGYRFSSLSDKDSKLFDEICEEYLKVKEFGGTPTENPVEENRSENDLDCDWICNDAVSEQKRRETLFRKGIKR